MTLNQILKWLVIGGLFALLFTPLIVTSSLFFPFITGKAFFLRIVIEIVSGAWLILAILNPEYRPKRSVLLWSILLFGLVLSLATFFGVNPAKSFWSNFERMEGLVTHLHFLAYFLVASSVLTLGNLWRRFFQTSLGVSVLVALYGIFQLLGYLTINQGGVRLDATFGNATYLAIYMVFHLFLAAWLFVGSSKKWERIIYGLIMLLELVVLYYTATRGAILGLIAGALISAALIAWQSNGQARKFSLGLIAMVIIFIGAFIAAKDLPIIKNNPVLGRFASISTTETTTQSRFIIWQIGFEGFKEKPILGWGPENYNLVFNKYYDPRLWRQEQWFDRSHNVIFDWLIAAGLLGLLSYLSMFIAGLWILKKSSRKMEEKSLLVGLLAAYFVHNFFVFDNLVSYLFFFSTLAFIASFQTTNPKLIGGNKIMSAGINATLGIIVTLLTLGVLYGVNIKPFLTNRELIKAMTPGQTNTAEAATAYATEHLAGFKKAIDYGTLGSGEAREQLTQWTLSVLNMPAVSGELKQQAASYTFEQLAAQAKAGPGDARSYLFVGIFLSAANQKAMALDYLQQASDLSPKKQAILIELARTYAANNNIKEALVVAKKALDLDPNYPEARTVYAALLIYSGDIKQADEILEEGFGSIVVNDNTILNAYADAKLFNRVLEIWKLKVATEPQNVQSWVSLAAAYLSVGDRTKSIESIEQAIVKNPQFKAEGEGLINEIRAGRNP